LDGVNLVPYLMGKEKGDPHEAIYLRMYDKGAFAVRRGDYKVVIPERGSAPELYDLSRDIGEKTNMAGTQPDQLNPLEALREAWNAQLITPAFGGRKSRSEDAGQGEAADE
jgi:hypothetical protein